MFGCLRRLIGIVVVLVLLAVGVWYFRAPLLRAWRDVRQDREGVPMTAAATAREAQRKLEALADGAPPGRVALSGPELQSLLSTRFAMFLPAYVDSPRIALGGGRVHLRARVPTDHLPHPRGVGEVIGMLPDTTDVTVTGEVIPLPDGRFALAVDEVTAAHIPLPHRLVPALIAGLRKGATKGVPADALPLPLPRAARAAYVRGDSLILIARGAAAAPGAATTSR